MVRDAAFSKQWEGSFEKSQPRDVGTPHDKVGCSNGTGGVLVEFVPWVRMYIGMYVVCPY